MMWLFLMSLAHADPVIPLDPLPAGACPTAADHDTYGWSDAELYAEIMETSLPATSEEAFAVLDGALPAKIVAYEASNGPTWGTACAYARYARLYTHLSPDPTWPDEVKVAFEDIIRTTVLPTAMVVEDKAKHRAQTAATSGQAWASGAEALVQFLGAPG